VIQDPADPLVQLVGFGERSSFESTGKSDRTIRTFLPADFGKAGYAERRSGAIRRHLQAMLSGDVEDLLWTFDYLQEGSAGLRQYLWAHREGDVERARRVAAVLGPGRTRTVLEYLVGDYWGRYLGWPDILAWRGEELCFVEVKLAPDHLSDEQRRWIEANQRVLLFPFKLFRIGRASGARGV
jgi:hypothetical protein